MAAAARISGTRFPWSSRLKWGVAALSATRRTAVLLEVVEALVAELLEDFAVVWAQAVPAAQQATVAAILAVFRALDTHVPARLALDFLIRCDRRPMTGLE